MNLPTVTTRLPELLKERNMTQLWLSKLTGIPQGTISRFGRNERIMVAHMFAIAKALNVRVEDLFEVTYD